MTIATMIQRANAGLVADNGAPRTAVVAPFVASQPDKGTSALARLFGQDIANQIHATIATRTMGIPLDTPALPNDVTPMLNANRPVDEIPAPTIGVPAASVPTLQSVGQTLSVAKMDWKKYLPWLLILIVIVAAIAMSKKRSA